MRKIESVNIKQEFRGKFIEVIDHFNTIEKDLVTWERTDDGIFVVVTLQTGEFRTKHFWTMYFAGRFFNKLRGKYGKRESGGRDVENIFGGKKDE